MSRNGSVRQALDAALHPLQTQTLREVDQLTTVAGMVEVGLGISVVPAFTLFHFERKTWVTRPLFADAGVAPGCEYFWQPAHKQRAPDAI